MDDDSLYRFLSPQISELSNRIIFVEFNLKSYNFVDAFRTNKNSPRTNNWFLILFALSVLTQTIMNHCFNQEILKFEIFFMV